MKYTPRKIAALVFYAARRQKRDHAAQLSLNTLAARGEKDDLKAAHRSLQNNGA